MKSHLRLITTFTFVLLFTALFLTSGTNTSAQDSTSYSLQLNSPNGYSPKVFTEGWVFDVSCVLNPGEPNQQDISNQVHWSGTGVFSPNIGKISHPIFNNIGMNTITFTVNIDGKPVTHSFSIEAVSPFGSIDNPSRYAAVGDQSRCRADAHGCLACPHNVIGPILTGSPNVTINGKPAARVGDTGVHAACCGSNTFKITEGDPNVLIDGRPAARLGDTTSHCGGTGKIVEG
jgi:uncharacterized Zn-binding protein involved in type VI secretion